MNEFILVAMNRKNHTQEELDDNRTAADAAADAATDAYTATAADAAAATADAAADAAAYAAADAADAANAAANAAAAAYAAYAYAAAYAECWINRYFESTGEDRQLYTNEIERINNMDTDEQHADKLNEMDKELDVMDIDWSKAPEGTTHYGAETGTFHGGFYKIISSDEGFFYDNNQWLACISRKERLTERPQPVFTQAMADNGELPQVGSKFNHQGRIVKTLSTSSEEGGVVTFLYGTDIGCCWNNSSWVMPIDTRTDKEKAIDDIRLSCGFNKINAMESELLSKAYDKWVGE